MAARALCWKFEMNFGGVDSYIIWHIVVVLVCKVEWFCENPKSIESRI
jgi:hypothetical protein